jgi:dethiobiotin synthetase
MPDLIVLVTGTATGVGKTWFTAETIRLLRKEGWQVAARKPAQSFDPADGETDAQVLAAATGEDPAAVCPPHRSYEVAMAPPMAADALGRPPFTIDNLVGELSLPTEGIVFIESAGGPRSPLARDGDTVTLAEKIACDLILLIADAGLGAINAVMLSAGALAAFPLVVALNRYDESSQLHLRNLEWLKHRGLEVVTSPTQTAKLIAGRLRQAEPIRSTQLTNSEVR